MSYQVPNNTGFVPCPRCGSTEVKPVNFVWWGGALAPRLFKLVKCQHCTMLYKGKTGESTERVMWLYLGLSGLVTLVALVLLLAL